MLGGCVDVADGLAVDGPGIEVAPALGVMFGEGVVEGGCAGPGVGGEAVARLQPLLVQRIEAVECGMQDTELPYPVALYRAGWQLREVCLSGGQQVTGSGADGLERGGGVGVALALAESVGVVVVRPAVETGVLLGVGVPGVEDLLAVADEGVEVAQELAVRGGIEGNGGVSFGVQRRAVGRVVPVFVGGVAAFG